MKLLRILGGIVAGFSGIAMFIAFFKTMNGTNPGISGEIIDSFADKIFFFLLTAGGGITFMAVSVHLFKKWKTPVWKGVKIALIASSFALALGYGYHMVFLSPW